MRLTKITAGSDENVVLALRWLTDCHAPILEASQPLFPYFLLKAIVTSPLTEADQGGFATILQAGLARMRAALTPNKVQDLDALMTFMAPQKGGAKAVQDLLTAAKTSRVPLNQDEDWWANLFDTLNITDSSAQDDIKRQVGAEFAPPATAPAPSVATPAANPATRAAQSGQAVRQKLERPSYADELNDTRIQQERDEIEKYRKELLDTMNQARAGRERASQRMRQMRGSMGPMMSQLGPHEEIINPMLAMIVEYPTVRQHLPALTVSALRHMGCRAPITEQRLVEAGLFDKIRTMAANPGYAAGQLQDATVSSDNERAAKLAIQVALKYLQAKFSGILQDNGLLPDDILKTYNTWRQMRMQQGADPNVIGQLENKLKQAFRLFNVKKGGGQSEVGMDPTAPAEAQAPSQPNDDPLNPDAFAKELAQQMVWTAFRAMRNNQDPVAAAKQIAIRGMRVDQNEANRVWQMFNNWWAKQSQNQRGATSNPALPGTATPSLR